jgi:hypothetical protein
MQGTPRDNEYINRKRINLAERNPCGYEKRVIIIPEIIGINNCHRENLKILNPTFLLVSNSIGLFIRL